MTKLPGDPEQGGQRRLRHGLLQHGADVCRTLQASSSVTSSSSVTTIPSASC